MTDPYAENGSGFALERELFGADGVEELVGAEEEGVAGDGGGGVELGVIGVDDIAGEFFELGFGGEDEGAGFAGDAVEAVADEDGGGVEGFATATGAVLDGALAVNVLTGFGVQAGGEALVVDDVEVAVVEDGGGDVGAGVGVPEFVGFCEVASAADFEGGAAGGGVAAEDEEFVAAVDDGGGDVAWEAVVGEPAEFAGVGVEAPEFLGDGEDEIEGVGAFNDGGGAVGGVEAITFGFPEDGAGFDVEGDEGAAFVGGVDDEFAVVEDGAGSGAPAFGGGGFAEVGLPEFFAGHVEGKGSGFAEEDVDVLAVGDGGVGGVTVLGDEALIGVFGLLGRDIGLPEFFAVFEAVAEEVAGEFGDVTAHVGGAVAGPASEVDFVSPDDGAGGAGAGDGGAPEDVFFGGPGEGDFGVGGGGVAFRAEETGPVGGVGSGGGKEQESEEGCLHGEVEHGWEAKVAK